MSGSRQRWGLGERADPRLAPAIAQLRWQEDDFFVRETLTWVLTRTPATATEVAIVNGQVEVPGFGQVEVPTLCGIDQGVGSSPPRRSRAWRMR